MSKRIVDKIIHNLSTEILTEKDEHLDKKINNLVHDIGNRTAYYLSLKNVKYTVSNLEYILKKMLFLDKVSVAGSNWNPIYLNIKPSKKSPVHPDSPWFKKGSKEIYLKFIQKNIKNTNIEDLK